MGNNTDQLEQDQHIVGRMIYGNWMQQVTYVFAELGIADVLINSPKTLGELAKELDVISSYLTRYMRCASELGYVGLDVVSRKYTLKPRGELLTSTHPQSRRDEARLNGEGYRYLPWANLINIIKHGIKEEYSPTIKDGTLEYLKDKPKMKETFHNAMDCLSKMENLDIIKDYDFSSFSKVMDIGCGKGSFLKGILDKYLHLQGIMFDIPGAFGSNEVGGYNGRLTKVTGDFFKEIPNTADVYIMKNIIHNWPEHKAKNILNAVRKAMVSISGIETNLEKKRFLIIENIIPDNGTDHIANWMDLNFMICIDGAERTKEQYKTLGEECGLKLENTHPTKTGRHIIEYSIL